MYSDSTQRVIALNTLQIQKVSPCLHQTGTKLDRQPKRFRLGCSVVVSRCLHETVIDRSEIIPAAQPKRVFSDRHKLGPVRGFRHVNTNYFQIGLWLNKVHASHVHTCS